MSNPVIQPLSEEQKARLRVVDADWAYNMCCGRCPSGCYIEQLTGA